MCDAHNVCVEFLTKNKQNLKRKVSPKNDTNSTHADVMCIAGIIKLITLKINNITEIKVARHNMDVNNVGPKN